MRLDNETRDGEAGRTLKEARDRPRHLRKRTIDRALQQNRTLAGGLLQKRNELREMMAVIVLSDAR